MRGITVAGLAVGLASLLVGTEVVASAVSLLGAGRGTPAATPAATTTIPPPMLVLYQEAAATCPGLPWTILAAIGTVESDNGQSQLVQRADAVRRDQLPVVGDLFRPSVSSEVIDAIHWSGYPKAMGW